jgi:hypothetical protein
MDRTPAQPQVNLSLLRSNFFKFQPLEMEGGGGVMLHTVKYNKGPETEIILDLL